MPESRGWALVGDPTPERFALLRDILEDDFLTNAVGVGSHDELKAECKSREWRLVLVAHNLPRSPSIKTPFLERCYNYLDEEVPMLAKACVVGATEPLELEMMKPPPHRIHVESTLPSPEQRERIITELNTIIRRAPRLPEVVPADSPSLREQLRRLSASRDLEQGKAAISHLVRDLFDWDRVEVDRLGQGASGARVFRVHRRDAVGEAKEFFLKLSPSADFWKIRLEVEKHEAAKQRLGVEGYRTHFVKLVEPRFPYEPGDYSLKNVVYYGNWYAVCYDFLGESKFGKFIDLETALVASADELSERTRDTSYPVAEPGGVTSLRLRLFETALDWLYKNWYTKDGLWRREARSLWETRDTPHKQYPVMPPYRLSGKSKAFILSFLDSDPAKLGGRFLAGWDDCRRRVWDLVERSEGATHVPLLDRELPVVVSPAHGDLNANNLLLWLDKPEHPFLIDFPFYQQDGHALQDFARLEVEIKLTLMDRQGDSPVDELKALDYTFTQLPLWREMEDHLLSDDWRQPKTSWSSGGYVGNVEFCLRLIQTLRARAADVQRQGAGTGTPDFFAEYLPPLLYYTARAIGYDTRSIFKRLLSVYSAGQIIGR